MPTLFFTLPSCPPSPPSGEVRCVHTSCKACSVRVCKVYIYIPVCIIRTCHCLADFQPLFPFPLPPRCVRIRPLWWAGSGLRIRHHSFVSSWIRILFYLGGLTWIRVRIGPELQYALPIFQHRISGFMYMLIENPFLDLIIYILVFYSIFTNMKK